MTGHVLVVDDEKSLRVTLKEFFIRDGYEVTVAEDADAAIRILKNTDIDVVVSDIILPRITGVELLSKIKEQWPMTQVIMITGEPTIETASEALRAGAFDYLNKPVTKDKLLKTVNNALAAKRLNDEKIRLEAQNKEYQVKLEHLFKESREHYRIAIESSSDGFVLSNDGLISFCNQTFLDIFGYDSSKEVVDQPFSKFVHPDDRGLVLENAIKRQKGEDAPSKYVFKGIRKNNNPIYVEISTTRSKVNDETLSMAFLRDVTLNRLAVDSLKNSEERFRQAFEFANDGICMIDADGKLMRVNRQMARILGYSKTELEGKTIYDITHPEDLDASKSIINKYFSGKINNIVFEKKYLHKNRNTIWGHISSSMAKNSKGKPLYIISHLQDISDRKKAEFEKEELERKIRHMQKMEAIGTLAGGIAHDFNNILTSIIGFSELCIDDAADGTPMYENLHEVLTAGIRAKELVKQILTFSRKHEIEVKSVNLRLMINETLKMLRSTFPATISIKHEIECDGFVNSDPTQIHQILMNLCTNAAHAMDEKGGSLEVKLKEVKLDETILNPGSVLKPGEYVRLSVRDTGTGIPDDIIDSIFEPYFTTKSLGEGTGLGLAAVHGIVTSLGGEISVKSIVGEGTKFDVFFPKLPTLIDVESPHEEIPTGDEHILFVDDEESIIKMGTQILKRLGYTVTTCTSSLEALDKFKRTPKNYDLVISDMTMPEMTGEQLAVKLMEIKKNIPVIICTGFSNKISKERIDEIGIKALLPKPIKKSELAKIIKKVLDG